MRVNAPELKNISFQNQETDLTKGRKLICFFSLKCPVCKLAASKLALIYEQSNNSFPIYFIYLDNKNKNTLLPDFIKETKAENIPYTISCD